jgi:Sulfatase
VSAVGIIVGVLAILALAAFGYIHRAYRLVGRRALTHIDRGAIEWSIASATVFAIALGMLVWIPTGPAALGWLAVVVLGFVIFDALDFLASYHFDDRLLKVYRHLPALPGLWSAPRSYIAYFVQYFPFSYALIGAAAFGLAGSIVMLASSGSHIGSLAGAIAIFAAGSLYLRKQVPAMTMDEAAVFDLLTRDEAPRAAAIALRREVRAANLALRDDIGAMPKAIVIVILESAGADITSTMPGLTLGQNIRRVGGDEQHWIAPANVVTNSSCTDVSIPSILTGCGSHETEARLHTLPFVMDLAKARGFRTAFLTSSTLGWGNFDAFFAGAALDFTYTAAETGSPYINDLTVDDFAIVIRASQWIEATQGPVCAVLYLNAMHVPFQATSTCSIPPSLTARRDRAAFIVERSMAALFDSLKRTGRYDDALIFVVGDHGETRGYDGSNEAGRMSRTIKLTPEVISPVFLMKPHQSLSAEARKTLSSNETALVANVDIAPTIADALSIELSGGLTYCGHSLFKPIAADRISYTLTINEWRSWNKGAVAICRGQDRIFVDYQTSDLVLQIRADGSSTSKRQSDTTRKELFEAAVGHPVVKSAIAYILKDKRSSG